MNAYLIAEHGVPPLLLAGSILVLMCVFGQRRSYAPRDRRGHHVGGFFLLIVVLGALFFWLNHGARTRTFEVRGDLPTSWTPNRPAPPGAMIAVSERGIAVMAPPVPAAPEPAIVEWPLIQPVQEVARTAPAAAESVPAQSHEKPQEKPAKSDVPTAGAAKERPAWVDAMPGKRDGVYQAKASSGPWSTDAECEKALNQDLRRVVANYLNDLRSDGQSIDGDIPLSYIKKNIVKDTYREVVDSPTVGPMIQLHDRLEFSPQVQEDLQDRWRSRMVDQRLERLTSVAVGIFGVLGSLFGFLKFDAFTQGKYRWPLGFATGALWLALLGLVFGK